MSLGRTHGLSPPKPRPAVRVARTGGDVVPGFATDSAPAKTVPCGCSGCFKVYIQDVRDVPVPGWKLLAVGFWAKDDRHQRWKRAEAFLELADELQGGRSGRCLGGRSFWLKRVEFAALKRY